MAPRNRCKHYVDKFDIWKIKPSRSMYWQLIDKHFPYNLALKAIWEADLRIELEEETWWQIYPNFIKLVKPVKLRYMQYRILTKSLTTNLTRSKWGQSPSTCYFCKTQTETVIHLMYKCEKVKTLWTALKKFIKYYYNVDSQLDEKTIMLNNYTGQCKEQVNFLIIALKQFIYSTKCAAQELKFTNYVKRLSYWYLIDKYNACQSKTYEQFRKKWKELL